MFVHDRALRITLGAFDAFEGEQLSSYLPVNSQDVHRVGVCVRQSKAAIVPGSMCRKDVAESRERMSFIAEWSVATNWITTCQGARLAPKVRKLDNEKTVVEDSFSTATVVLPAPIPPSTAAHPFALPRYPLVTFSTSSSSFSSRSSTSLTPRHRRRSPSIRHSLPPTHTHRPNTKQAIDHSRRAQNTSMAINRLRSRLSRLSDRAAERKRRSRDRGARDDRPAGVKRGVGRGASGDGGCARDGAGGLAGLWVLVSLCLDAMGSQVAYDVADRSVESAQGAAVAVDRSSGGVGRDGRAAATWEVDDGGAGRAWLCGVGIRLSHCSRHQADGDGHEAGKSVGGAHDCGG